MNRELIAASDAQVSELVPMPADAADVCPLCRSGRTNPTALCFSCRITTGQVRYPTDLVIPITYYAKPSPLRERMHNFKTHDDPRVRAVEGRNVAAIAARYVAEQFDALAARFGDWHSTVVVPSTTRRGSPALQTAIESNFPGVFKPFERPLRPGPGEMGFNKASEEGFTVDAALQLRGRRFLLIDDTYTTGARVQSAHHALVNAGAEVAAVVVVARKINPDPSYGTDELWDRQRSQDFDFKRAPWWL